MLKSVVVVPMTAMVSEVKEAALINGIELLRKIYTESFGSEVATTNYFEKWYPNSNTCSNISNSRGRCFVAVDVTDDGRPQSYLKDK